MPGVVEFYIVILVLQIVLGAVVMAGLWLIFEKTGQPGWHVLIPVYNSVCIYRIGGFDWWWILLPIVNAVIYIMALHRISTAFGHGGGYTMGLLFLPFVFWPMLGTGAERYSPNWEA